MASVGSGQVEDEDDAAAQETDHDQADCELQPGQSGNSIPSYTGPFAQCYFISKESP